MFRRLLTLALLLVVIAGVMPRHSQAQDSTTITYFTFSAAPDHLGDLDTIIAAFEAENPTINVEVETAAFADYFTLLQGDFVADDAPDVFELNYESFVSYAANDVLLDLSDSISADAAYYPAALGAFQYEGAQLALPESFSTVLLFYNAELFDAAGLEYPTAEWTWAEAVEAGKAIRALGEDTWGIYSPVQFWEFYKKAGQNGCSFFNAEMTESTINAPECVAALETMMSFMTEDIMPDPVEQAGVSPEELFQNGQVGMLVTGIWMFGAFAELPFTWDVQIEPGLANKGHHFFANGIAVAKTTEHPAEAAAWAQYLTSSEVAANVRVATGWELPALDKPEYFAAYLEVTPPTNRAAVFQALESPIVPPVIVRQNEMQDSVNALLEAVVNGELDPQTALDLAKEELDGFIAE